MYSPVNIVEKVTKQLLVSLFWGLNFKDLEVNVKMGMKVIYYVTE